MEYNHEQYTNIHSRTPYKDKNVETAQMSSNMRRGE